MASTFDPLKLSKRLEEAGLSQRQAEMISLALAEELVKENERISSFHPVDRVEIQLALRIDKLDAKIEALDRRLTRYFEFLFAGLLLLGIILKIHL
ncbi:DUF1640 domain-containing protein [Methylacidiphilum caldifontis]|uniref:DUF1640 domain-containing protein n=1 Tax=Methylacidiphilum caldifontis TaxID=2795386 RepID=A0A4Y8PGW6_9BACT|nr:DUF1640 domain-containing protein [Methylacidiphilum caldifontis]QSR88558.1 DUF1640 domain-containing protein [Methylacidiphilum caldifontis]TFE72087.1 DUF1640 domain-containing protein [Methylacidiphilum caldifontis]